LIYLKDETASPFSVQPAGLADGWQEDVQFDNLDATYEFGLAAFDNAQVRYAFQVGAIQLKFAK
jgi:hypothetical protein